MKINDFRVLLLLWSHFPQNWISNISNPRLIRKLQDLSYQEIRTRENIMGIFFWQKKNSEANFWHNPLSSREDFPFKGEVPSAADKLQCLNRRISRLERAHRTSLELKFDGGFIFKVYFLIAQLFPIQNPRFYSFWELLQQYRDFSEIWGQK